MAGKKGGKGRGGGGKQPMKKEDTPMQAVILADSFDMRFDPLTLERPRALLPLANRPMLEYTLELLASSGVSHIFVYCVNHGDLIDKYIKSSRFAKREHGLGHGKGGQTQCSVRVICSQHCDSAGSALRDMCDKELITTDFVLVSGDVVSNLKLETVMKEHRRRKEADKNAIMTMVFKKAAPTHRSRSQEDETIVALNADTNKLLLYDNDPNATSFNLPSLLLKENCPISLRHDLIDCHIDICSPEVLYQFKDNFDYQELRHDFVKGITESDILGETLYCHIITGREYAARVRNLRTYASITLDVIHRWSYPLVPDNNIAGDTSYTHTFPFVYKDTGVILDSSCKVDKATVIGSHTVIEDGVYVSESVIGSNCKIGKGAVVVRAHLWDDCVVEAGAVVKDSIVANGARIGRGAKVERGCVVSFGVVVGEGIELKPFTKLTTCDGKSAQADDDVWADEEDVGEAVDLDLGVGGRGKEWVRTVKDTEFNNSLVLKPSRHTDILEREDSLGVDSDEESEEEESEADRFKREVADTLRAGVEKKETSDKIFMEINGLKFTYDRTFLDCATAMVALLMEVEQKHTEAKEFFARLKQNCASYSEFISCYLAKEEDTEAAHIELILTIQEFIEESLDSRKKLYQSSFQMIVHTLYENDTLEEDSILKWAEEQDELTGEERMFLDQCSAFLTWLREADDESDDDDDDDEDDEEDDEDDDEEEE